MQEKESERKDEAPRFRCVVCGEWFSAETGESGRYEMPYHNGPDGELCDGSGL